MFLCMIPPLRRCRSVLPLRREPERHLAVHGADRIPVHADVTTDSVDVAPSPLHGVCKIQSGAAGRGVEGLDRPNGKAHRKRLTAAAENAILDGDEPAVAYSSCAAAKVPQQK